MNTIPSKYFSMIAGSIIGIGAILFFGGLFGVFKSLHFEVFKSGVSNTPLQKSADISANQGNTADHSASTRYYSPGHHFFFDAPEGFRFTEIPDDSGDVVLAERNAGESFQIFITPFDEEGPLTLERIAKDIPQKIVQNPRTATLDGEKAIAFSSREGSSDVFEAWFVHGGSLYQITTGAEFAGRLQDILQTWKFQ